MDEPAATSMPNNAAIWGNAGARRPMVLVSSGLGVSGRAVGTI